MGAIQFVQGVIGVVMNRLMLLWSLWSCDCVAEEGNVEDAIKKTVDKFGGIDIRA